MLGLFVLSKPLEPAPFIPFGAVLSKSLLVSTTVPSVSSRSSFLDRVLSIDKTALFSVTVLAFASSVRLLPSLKGNATPSAFGLVAVGESRVTLVPGRTRVGGSVALGDPWLGSRGRGTKVGKKRFGSVPLAAAASVRWCKISSIVLFSSMFSVSLA